MTDQEISAAMLVRLVGAGNDADVERALRESFPEDERASVGSIMRLSPAPWTASASTLSRDELAALVRALTVAEVILDGWTAGSVSPVIWTFRVFQSKFADQADVLADWVLLRTVNQYLPYETRNFGARSRSELRLLLKASDERRAAEQTRSCNDNAMPRADAPKRQLAIFTAQFDDVTSRQQRRSFTRAPIHEVQTKLVSRPLIRVAK